MVFPEVPQGRTLAIMLPCMTLMAHVVNFFALEALFATSWSTSYCAWYDVVAAIASAIGVFGAVKRHPALVSSYAFVHAITLTVISLVLFISIFPASLSQANSIHFGGNFEQSICHGSVDGLGWNAAWFEQCKSNFRLLSTGAAWISSILMAAQWWALFGVCKWNSGMKNERQKREQDIEERGYSNEKDELWT